MVRIPSIAAALLLAGALGLAAEPIQLEVQYVTADRVYIDGGSRFGLESGDRLAVRRGDRLVARIEVVYTATHSASCRLMEGSSEPLPGDAVVWDAPVEGRVVRAATTSETTAVRAATASQQPSAARSGFPSSTVEPTPPAPAVPEAPVYRRTEPENRGLRASTSGSLSFDWEQFTDDSERGRDFDRTAARVSLRGRNLAGTPLQLRVRASTRTLDRMIDTDGSSSISETRDRLYELALAWEPPEGRFALRLGRLRLGRYAGAGTIDGISAETRLGNAFHLGVFGGSRSDISDLGIDSDRTNYGVTARWSGDAPGRIRDFLVAGVREDGVEDVSREYVAVQTRLSGPRWSFYQRAEVDINRGWREELTGSTSQLSTLFVNATARISDRNRLSLSYSQFERYRTEETRFIPEELFDDRARQGLRLRWTIGRANGFNVNLSAGLRERDGDSENATSAGLGVRHNNLFGRRFSLGLDLLSFSNEFSEGATAVLRAGKRFKGGHHLTLTAGGRSLDDLLRDETRDTQWFRLGAWFELPARMYARTEVEVSSGDDLEGQRVLVGLGYRL